MSQIKEYLDLMKQYPSLFVTPQEEGAIRIITDEVELRREYRIYKKEFALTGNPMNWIDIGIVAEDKWFYVIRDLVQFPKSDQETKGKIGAFIRFVDKASLQKGPASVVMVSMDEKILLIRHFRHENRKFYWEFPRGFGETNTSSKKNAKMELRQEIDAVPVDLVQIGSEKSASGRVNFFYAHIEGFGKPEKEEGISRIKLISVPELEKWIKNGTVADMFSIKAYTLAKLNKMI